jgi:hypothetical protein
LKAFPRRLAEVYFHDQAMVIKWFDLEKDTAVLEQAFALGIDCPQTLASR